MALRVDMTGNSTGFTHMLNTARAEARAFNNALNSEVASSWGNIGKNIAAGIAGFIGVQTLTSKVQWFIETGKQIEDMSEQIGMSTDSWQKWSDAVQRAGLSTEGFNRVIEALRQKRTDALNDPKARAQLSRLGFSDADISGNMDMSEFTKHALANANANDLQRGYLADIIGNRGLKYATALSQLPNSQALFSETDLKNAAEGDRAEKTISKAIGKMVVGAVSDAAKTINDLPQHPTGLTWSWRNMLFGGAGKAWDYLFSTPHYAALPVPPGHRPGYSTGHAGAQYGSPIGPEALNDPMDAKLSAQQDQMALQDDERQRRIEASNRELMTIGDRRKSLKEEAASLQEQIAKREAAMESPEGFLTEAQKNELAGVTGKSRTFAVNELREKYLDQTASLKESLNRDKSELKQQPLSFQGDSLARVGLYSASAIQFNPLLGLNKTNQILEKIASNTAPRVSLTSNPHRP